MRIARLVLLAAAACAATAVSAQQAADNYPAKPIRMIVALPPGGSNDILARAVAQDMTAAWGQPVVVENRPGANSIIAVDQLLKAPADGYTILVVPQSGVTVNPHVYEKLPYDPAQDLAPITMLGSLPLLLTVHPNVPAKSMKELIALAKSRPGELNYGTPTITFHVVAEQFSRRAGIQMTRIPYKGSQPTLTGLLGGDVQVAFIDPAPALPHIKSARIRALAITSAKRAPYLPDVPTVAEQGLEGYELTVWIGLFTRADVPPSIIKQLQVQTARTLNEPQMREKLLAIGIEAGGQSPEDFASHLHKEAAEFGAVIKAAGIRIE